MPQRYRDNGVYQCMTCYKLITGVVLNYCITDGLPCCGAPFGPGKVLLLKIVKEDGVALLEFPSGSEGTPGG